MASSDFGTSSASIDVHNQERDDGRHAQEMDKPRRLKVIEQERSSENWIGFQITRPEITITMPTRMMPT